MDVIVDLGVCRTLTKVDDTGGRERGRPRNLLWVDGIIPILLEWVRQ